MGGDNGEMVRNDGVGFIPKRELTGFDGGMGREKEREESRMRPIY